jgi:hypothetical protein
VSRVAGSEGGASSSQHRQSRFEFGTTFRITGYPSIEMFPQGDRPFRSNYRIADHAGSTSLGACLTKAARGCRMLPDESWEDLPSKHSARPLLHVSVEVLHQHQFTADVVNLAVQDSLFVW